MATSLTVEQKGTFKKLLDEFRKTETLENEGEVVNYRDFDKKRLEAEKTIRPIIDQFLSGKVGLDEFKQASSDFSFKYPYWGFKAFSGQMQLNQYVNNIDDAEHERILRDAISVPNSYKEAGEKINRLADYLEGLKTRSGNPKSVPRVNQTYLLTYFWSLQDREKWPIYYGSYKKQFPDINFPIEVAETVGDEYTKFIDFFEALRAHLYDEMNVHEEVPYWFIEHVLWVQYTKKDIASDATKEKLTGAPQESNDWIPPIVADLPQLAANRESAWSKANRMAPERAFEIKLRYVFQILGFEVFGLGQGSGREPDGVAISSHSYEDPAYAIIFDAKAREKSYSMGTEDRAITEYIKKKRKELSRKHVDKLSFLVVSSEISDSPSTKELVAGIYKETRVPVVLMRAADLLHVVEEKLKNPDIDHGQLEHLFIETGLLTRDKIAEVLEVR